MKGSQFSSPFFGYDQLHFTKGLEEASNVDPDDIRILCLILTHPDNHKKAAYTVHVTWARRCTYVKFVTTLEDDLLPTVVTNTSGDYDHIWAKTKLGFEVAYQEYLDKVDWVLKADDDTFVIVENLKLLLNSYDTNSPIWLGCELKVAEVGPDGLDGYMMGGAGYVLSKEALRRFYEISLTNRSICEQGDTGAEDVNMGNCLRNVGVTRAVSTDIFGRYFFLPFFPDSQIGKTGWSAQGSWFLEYLEHKDRSGLDFPSEYAVSFHYVSPEMMMVLEYLIYSLNHGFGPDNKIGFINISRSAGLSYN